MLEKTYAKLLTNSRLTENNSDRLGPDLLADLDRVQKGNRSITRRIPMQGTQFIRQIEQKDDGFSIFLKMDVTAAQNEIERQQFLAAHAELAKSYAMIGLSDNPTAALQSICDYLGTMFSDCRVGIVLFDQDQKRGILAAGTKWPEGVIGKSRAYGIGQTELTAANHSYTVVKVNPDNDTIESPSNFWTSAAEEHCFVCRIGRKSAVRGAIVMYSKTLKTVLPTQISAIEGMAAIAGTALRTAMVQAELAENERHYRDLVGGLPILVGITDENFTFLQVNEAFEQLGVNQLDVGETSVSDIFGHEAAARLRRNLFYNDDTTTSCEALIPVPGGEDNYYLLQANRRQDGHPGFYIVALNIDERKKTEVLNKTISEELDHRVKNIIALINSIAFLTSQHTDNIDDFLDTFEDRLSMLGRTHSILAGTKWNGATVYDIVAAEISPFADVNSDRIRIDQTRFDLDVKGVQVIALVIHELTTNAIKYGALSVQSGILNVNWSQTSDDLIINWTESNVIGTKDSDHKGAGTQVIHSTIERQLGGRVERNFTDDGISYQFVIPLIKITKQSDD
ncbi:hypothetical protein BVC71_12785 [Marivivens niveibacter]|uniref:histidine kinase n=2 Tax=Marivivens niveibacter TaxID=1930667 RepID=A0A251WVG4_9RHOB|nr:hypothetical protein BVC71_12785 [Marivivens niveibacter]